MFSIGNRSEILEGDSVVVYMTPEQVEMMQVTSDAILHNKYGRFSHNEIIGKSFGCKWTNLQQSGHLYVLRMTPDLWTRVLPHRTQIIYLSDISFIIQMLELRPGMTVVESGTGSGSMSHHIAQSILPNGHLYTFDFHDKRVEHAVKEFANHGLDNIVNCIHRNVVNDGFEMEKEEEKDKEDQNLCISHSIKADCVFLDLPSPWDVIHHAKKVLRKDAVARICCYSPCIEQVQKTLGALLKNEFHEVEMYECLVREHEVSTIGGHERKSIFKRKLNEREVMASPSLLVSRPITEMRGHTSFLTFAKLIPML